MFHSTLVPDRIGCTRFWENESGRCNRVNWSVCIGEPWTVAKEATGEDEKHNLSDSD